MPGHPSRREGPVLSSSTGYRTAVNPLLRRSSALGSTLGGQALRATTRAIALRPATKPLHPDGAVMTGRLLRTGTEPAPGRAAPSGVPLLDEPGEDDVVLRRSRAVGLPRPLPDIHGLAVRLPSGGDLLFATTGLGRATRFVLTVGSARAMTTLLPYRSPTGPVVLAAVPRTDHLDMLWARPRGRWQRFGTLEIVDVDGDPTMSFDPVLHPVPGLEVYDWVHRLREPAYRAARRSRE